MSEVTIEIQEKDEYHRVMRDRATTAEALIACVLALSESLRDRQLEELAELVGRTRCTHTSGEQSRYACVLRIGHSGAHEMKTRTTTA